MIPRLPAISTYNSPAVRLTRELAFPIAIRKPAPRRAPPSTAVVYRGPQQHLLPRMEGLEVHATMRSSVRATLFCERARPDAPWSYPREIVI
jgi:hypothetical protein